MHLFSELPNHFAASRFVLASRSGFPVAALHRAFVMHVQSLELGIFLVDARLDRTVVATLSLAIIWRTRERQDSLQWSAANHRTQHR
jgi:hypothetical protein